MKSRNRKPCIYAAQSITTKMMYIGQSKDGITKRKNDHLKVRFNKGDKFHLALRDLGPEDFVWDILYVVEEELETNELKELLSEKEQYYIRKYNSIEKGYNTLLGNSGAKNKYRSLEEKRIATNKRRREKRKNWTEEQRELHRQKRIKTREANDYRKKQKIRFRQKRLNMTEEQRKLHRERQRLRTPEKTERKRKRIANMTPQELETYKEAKKARKLARLAKLTPEEKKVKHQIATQKRHLKESINPEIKEKRKLTMKIYRENNKERLKEYHKKYVENNREKLRTKRNEHRKNLRLIGRNTEDNGIQI